MTCWFIKHLTWVVEEISCLISKFLFGFNFLFSNSITYSLYYYSNLFMFFVFLTLPITKCIILLLAFINSFIQYQRQELKSTKKSQLVYNKSFNKNSSILFMPQGKHEMHEIISIFSFLCSISSIFCSIAVWSSIFSFV